MGLLPELFAKEELAKLRLQLAEADTARQRLAAQLSERILAYESLLKDNRSLQTTNQGLQQELGRTQEVLKEAQAAARAESQNKEREIALLNREFLTIKAINAQLVQQASELTISRDEFEAKWHQTLRELATEKSRMVDRTAEYAERETRLADKSERLQAQKAKLQDQQHELHLRESRWEKDIAPMLAAYEEHQQLDGKRAHLEALSEELQSRRQRLEQWEAALEQRHCTDENLNRRETQVSAREQRYATEKSELEQSQIAVTTERQALTEKAAELKRWSTLLTKQQERVDGLLILREEIREREKALVKKTAQREEEHQERLTDIRQQRSELRALRKDLNEREQAIGDAEVAIERLTRNKSKLEEQVALLRGDLRDCLNRRGLFGQGGNVNVGARPRGRDSSRSAPEPEEIEINEYDPERDGGDFTFSLREQSPLTAYGYRVGSSGIEDVEERREVLRRFICLSLRQLPQVAGKDYMRQWGEAQSAKRVRCIAFHLEWNIWLPGAKPTNSIARQHWIEDLQWLTRHYKGKIPASDWPTVPRK